ncbi:MAG: hypothetical protein QOG20_1569 [Pseudonocardiales bacterium]|nr:hypothetical protein [Pseudonocardiales bacterium]
MDTRAIPRGSLATALRADDFAVCPEALAAAIPGAQLRPVPGDHVGVVVASPQFRDAIVEFLG